MKYRVSIPAGEYPPSDPIWKSWDGQIVTLSKVPSSAAKPVRVRHAASGATALFDFSWLEPLAPPLHPPAGRARRRRVKRETPRPPAMIALLSKIERNRLGGKLGREVGEAEDEAGAMYDFLREFDAEAHEVEPDKFNKNGKRHSFGVVGVSTDFAARVAAFLNHQPEDSVR